MYARNFGHVETARRGDLKSTSSENYITRWYHSFKDGLPYLIEEKDLPLVLPEVDKYLPTEDGDAPLGRAKNWNYQTAEGEFPLERSTMPGWAGSSWYFFRYTDPKNEGSLADKAKTDYWGAVDLYIGGSEHATGHLLYSRFWTKFLFDIGAVGIEEPFQKMINQGMIQGRSNFVYRIKGTNTFVSFGLKDQYKTTPVHVDVNIVEQDFLDIEQFKASRPDFADAEFILENGNYLCGYEVEKMSKSKFNVVNPDDMVERYGADTLRLYEMFLGPLEQAKPWSTAGISGVHSFLKKLWRLFHLGTDEVFNVSQTPANKDALKVLHKTIKKVEDDIENFSFNTSVSTFMIAVNELTAQKCNSKEILEPLTILISPYAPHIAEELWSKLGHQDSISGAGFPVFDPSHLVESSKEYPISFNGKMRFKMELPLDMSKEDIEAAVMANPKTIQQLDGRVPKKVIVVPGKIINIVG